MTRSVALLLLLLLTLPALTGGAKAAPETLKGSQFIEAVERNTITGTTEDGRTFNLFFLPGGQATFEDDAGGRDRGSWTIDPDGDVCLTWVQMNPGETNCFQVTLDGGNLAWTGKSGEGAGMLRGTIRAGAVEDGG